ncbi:MAG: Trm112 family protein [Ignavibacteriaceae bacterium]
MISKDLLDILCCPETKAELVLDGETLVSTDKKTRRRYRIEDDIPVMLIDESEQLSMEDWTEIMKKHGKSTE